MRMLEDFRRSLQPSQHSAALEQWNGNIGSITKKVPAKDVLPGPAEKVQLASRADRAGLHSILQSVITVSIAVRCSSATKHDIHKLQHIIRSTKKAIWPSLTPCWSCTPPEPGSMQRKSSPTHHTPAITYSSSFP